MPNPPLDPARPNGKCGAHTRNDTRCGLPAGWGTEHVGTGSCQRHGGASLPQQQQRHERLVAERLVADVTARWNIPIDVSAEEFFMREMRRSAGAVAFLDQKVAELTDEKTVLGVTKIERGANGDARTTVEARASVWWKLWQEERKLGMSAARTAVELGIRAADHELSRATADTVIRIVRDALTAAGGDVTAGEAVVVTALAELAAPQE